MRFHYIGLHLSGARHGGRISAHSAHNAVLSADRVFLQMGKYGDAFFRDPDIVKNILRRNGMSCKIYSRKTIKAIHPNVVRRFFDDFVLLGVFMGEREEITIINYELSLTDSSKDDSSNLAGHEDS